MAKKPEKPDKKPGNQEVVVIDGNPLHTAQQEENFIQGYLNSGYSLLYIRTIQEKIIVPAGTSDPVGNCNHIDLIYGVRYYFVK